MPPPIGVPTITEEGGGIWCEVGGRWRLRGSIASNQCGIHKNAIKFQVNALIFIEKWPKTIYILQIFNKIHYKMISNN